jgi:uncharacterized membrane protein YczE
VAKLPRYIYIYICVCVRFAIMGRGMYIYIYRERERVKKMQKKKIMNFYYIILKNFTVLIISCLILCDIILIFKKPNIVVIINTC